MAKKNLLKLGIIVTTASIITSACLVGCNSVPQTSSQTGGFFISEEDKQHFSEGFEDFANEFGEQLDLTDEEKSEISDFVGNTKDEAEEELNEEEQSEVEEQSDVDFSTMEKVTVVRVVDGDTYVVNLDGEETKVRLIGVDTPESVAPDSYTEKTGKENTDFGKEVSDYMKEQIKEGDVLFLEFDVSKYDKYNRVLAYAYFPDGEMIQEKLLKEGKAQVMTVQPNSLYSKRFLEIQQKARDEGVGMWADMDKMFDDVEEEMDEVER